MKKLQALLKKCTIKLLRGGSCPMITKLSSNYKNEFKIDYYPFEYRSQMSDDVGIPIADIYDTLEHRPNNKLVKAAYNQLAREVINQFDYILKNEKIEFEPYKGTDEPYANSYEMLCDIHNYHMYFFKTESGFGEGTYTEKNVMLNKTGFKIDNYELVVNDLFRIIHDIFGHAMDGYGFGPIGEDKAWFTHLKIFSPLAAAALSMETRGQNCWVNFGKHLRDNNNRLCKRGEANYLPPNRRPFAKQKMNILPSFISGIEVFEQENTVKAKYLEIWNPIESILIK